MAHNKNASLMDAYRMSIDGRGSVSKASTMTRASSRSRSSSIGRRSSSKYSASKTSISWADLTQKREPQYRLEFIPPDEKTPLITYTSTTENHGVFEVRFHHLPKVKDEKNPGKEKLEFEAVIQKFEQFSALSVFYAEVNKKFFNLCPAFYRFTIQPFLPIKELATEDELYARDTTHFHGIRTEEKKTSYRNSSILRNSSARKSSRS